LAYELYISNIAIIRLRLSVDARLTGRAGNSNSPTNAKFFIGPYLERYKKILMNNPKYTTKYFIDILKREP
jgi:hypothetical protein